MSRPDKVYARFRGHVKADTAITGVYGTGSDLVNVTVNGSGDLVLAGSGLAEGVIWTPEGKADSGVANFNVAAAGSIVTVYTNAEFVGTGLTVGNKIWSIAAGDVQNSATSVPTQQIGMVVNNDPAKGGERFVVNIAPATDIT